MGLWDGVYLSNTHSLLIQKEGKDADVKATNDDGDNNEASEDARAMRVPLSCWRGVLIKADPRRFDDLARLHKPLGDACIRAHMLCLEGNECSLS